MASSIDATARVGTSLDGKYVLRRELGRGGMGVVFAAENTWTGRPVAIKVLRAEYAQDADLLERFWREARCASVLRHPNVVDVLDLGIDDATGLPFIVQELLDGVGLDRLLRHAAGERLPVVEALQILLPVMDALAACHAAGVLHRDVKPSNILLARRAVGGAVPKLIDFGISKATRDAGRAETHAGVALGTPQYMAPELARCERDVDARADVWAMGVTLYESLAGRLPFEGPSVHVIVSQVLHARAPPLRELAPQVPADVAACVDRALEPERARRCASMRELADALRACAPPAALEPYALAEPPAADGPSRQVTPPSVRPAALPSARPPPSVEAHTLIEPAEAPTRAATPRPGPRPPTPRIGGVGGVALVLVVASVFYVARKRPTPAPPRPPEAPSVHPPVPVTLVPPRLTASPAPVEAAPAPPVAPAAPVRPAVRRAPPAARPAQARDPLAPDETPYAQIQRRPPR